MSSLKRKIVENFTERVGELAEGLQSDLQLNPLGSLLYYLNDYSEKTKDVQLFSSIIEAKLSLLHKLLTRSNRYNPRIATYVLYFIELTEHMCRAFIKEEKESSEELEQNEIIRIIDIYLRSAGRVFYYIASYGRNIQQDEVKKYLERNAENFLNDRFKYRFKEHKELSKYYLVEYYRQRVYVGIFIFRRYYKQNAVHYSAVKDIGLKIADIIDRGYNVHGIDIAEEYNKMLYDSMFIREVPFEHYEEADLITAETGIGSIYNFNLFWVLLNLYRMHSFSGSQTRFIPTKADVQGNLLQDLINTIDKLDTNSKQKFGLILNFTPETINESLRKYKDYLEGLKKASP